MDDDLSGLSAKEVLEIGEKWLKLENEERQNQRKEEEKPIIACLSANDLKVIISVSLGLPLFICICMVWGTHFDISFIYIIKSYLMLAGGLLVAGSVITSIGNKISAIRKNKKKSRNCD